MGWVSNILVGSVRATQPAGGSGFLREAGFQRDLHSVDSAIDLLGVAGEADLLADCPPWGPSRRCQVRILAGTHKSILRGGFF